MIYIRAYKTPKFNDSLSYGNIYEIRNIDGLSKFPLSSIEWNVLNSDLNMFTLHQNGDQENNQPN